jgi:hypothetical protein
VASIWTDKGDYTPGETVLIFGAGFNPNAQISVSVIRPNGWIDNWYAYGDSIGSFETSYQLDGITGTYTVNATDGTNTATTTFTDAISPKSVEPSDSSGTLKYSFSTADNVYCHITITGSGTQTVRLYVVNSDPGEGSSLTDNSGGYETVNVTGDTTQLIWSATTIAGTYWAVVDYDCDGIFRTSGSYKDKKSSSSFTISNPPENITFQISGMSTDTSATVLTIDSTAYTYSQLPHTFIWTSTSTHTITASTPVSSTVSGKQYRWSSWTNGDGLSGVGLGTYTVPSSNQTVTATYVIQDNLTFTQTGLDSTATGTVENLNGLPLVRENLPYSIWVDNGTVENFTYSSIVSSTTSGKRFRLLNVSDSSPLTVTAPMTVTGNYIAQFKVIFAQTGLNGTATGTVVTENGSDKVFADLPFTTDWIDNNSILPFSYTENVTSSVTNKRFRLVSASETSPLTVTAAIIVTGNYVTQYKVTFAQTGLDSTATGTVVNIGALALKYENLSYSIWVDNAGSVTYNYLSIVSSSVVGKQFKLVDVTGKDSPITVTGPENVTGNYMTPFSTSLTYIGDSNDQYSDPITLSARLINIATQDNISGKTIYFVIENQSITANKITASAVTNDNGVATVLKIENLVPAGSYKVSATFEGDAVYLGSSDNKAFIINKENATVDYTGDTIVPTTSSTINLRATVFDNADGYWGDLTKIKVTFRIYTTPINDINSPYRVVGPVTVSTTNSPGVGVATSTTPNLPEDSYIVIVSIDASNNNYYCGPTSDPTSITVYEPTSSFVTGGGWIMENTGSKGNFGFVVRYNKSKQVKGQSVYVYRSGGWDYIVKSNAWKGLAIDNTHAYFESKCTVQMYNPATGEVVWSTGNYTFRVDALDNNKPGGTDVYQIRVLDKNGVVFHEAGFNPYGYLQGGNIVIHK